MSTYALRVMCKWHRPSMSRYYHHVSNNKKGTAIGDAQFFYSSIIATSFMCSSATFLALTVFIFFIRLITDDV